MSKSGDKVEKTQEQIDAEARAKEKWAWYQTNITPQLDKHIARVSGFAPGDDGAMRPTESKGLNSEGYYQQAAGGANSAVQSQFSQAIQTSLKQANPNSGRFQAVIDGGAIAEATTASNLKNRSEQSVQDMYLNEMGNLARMGQGEQAQASRGMMAITQEANQQAYQNAMESQANRQGWGQAITTGAGALAYHSDWGGQTPKTKPVDSYAEEAGYGI